MPRSGWPSGVTPMAVRRRTAAGITPPPHALSTGGAPGPGPQAARAARQRAADRRGQAHRPAADDEHVDHGAAALADRGAPAAARAPDSVRMRTVSSAAVSTVNAH